jgi:hypothetical protein
MAAALIGSSYAVEYVTLTDTNPSASLNPADRVEVVGLMNQSSGAAGVDLTIDGESAPKGGYVREGSTFSGLSLIRLNVGNAIRRPFRSISCGRGGAVKIDRSQQYS